MAPRTGTVRRGRGRPCSGRYTLWEEKEQMSDRSERVCIHIENLVGLQPLPDQSSSHMNA